VGRVPHPERMEITQPRVARNELPWGVEGPLNLNPERVLSKTLNRYPPAPRRLSGLEERVGERRPLDAATANSMAVLPGTLPLVPRREGLHTCAPSICWCRNNELNELLWMIQPT
jgi:hypothetical protein